MVEGGPGTIGITMITTMDTAIVAATVAVTDTKTADTTTDTMTVDTTTDTMAIAATVAVGNTTIGTEDGRVKKAAQEVANTCCTLMSELRFIFRSPG